MSLESARTKISKLGNKNKYLGGYCIPISIDSVMKHAKLPIEIYDMCYGAFMENLGHNYVFTRIIEDYFEIPALPSTDEAPVAVFNAFGSSPQTYFTEISAIKYDMEYMSLRGISQYLLRINDIIVEATEKNCLILFENTSVNGPHASGLESIDPLSHGKDARFLVRDNSYLVMDRLVQPNELSGIAQILTGKKEAYSKEVPLPEFNKPWYPTGQKSPTLIILPPEPKK